MEDRNMVSCWEDLANAVVLQALEDYRAVCRTLSRRPDLKKAAKRKKSLEKFFRSRWFAVLTAADLGAVLEEIRKIHLTFLSATAWGTTTTGHFACMPSKA